VAERILVTGASGFAGSHLIDLLSGSELHAWSRSEPPTGRGSSARWQRVDLTDRSAVDQAIAIARPALVYHCAGSPHVAASWFDTATPLANNVMGTHHLLDAIRSAGLSCRVLIPGSATVYASSATAISEQDPIAPASPYALSKFAQEQLGLRAVGEDGVSVIVARSFNHTGPRQTPAFIAPSIARQIALIERGAMEPVLKVGNLDARRDFTDVRDVVRAYAALIADGRSGEIYNVASGTARSMKQLLDALMVRSRVRIRVESDPARMRPHDTPLLVGDPAKLRRATGWSPMVSFEQMIDDLLEYWRAQP
jgi:GDP-4-dehydro-6-deoxy-D-mannose reductase